MNGRQRGGPGEAAHGASSDVLLTGAVLAQLERVLAHEIFRKSPSAGAFLRYVVEASLNGDGRGIDARTIAVEALGRDPATYDPQADPIVQVEAARLRGALERYYDGPGARDAIRIALARGAYVAQFAWRVDPEAGPAAPRRWPWLAILGAALILALAIIAAAGLR